MIQKTLFTNKNRYRKQPMVTKEEMGGINSEFEINICYYCIPVQQFASLMVKLSNLTVYE